MTLVIDRESLEKTAKALETLNPGRGSADYIEGQVRRHIQEGANTYLATGGWVAFTWLHPDTLDTHVSFAVYPYSVNRFLEQKGLAA